MEQGPGERTTLLVGAVWGRWSLARICQTFQRRNELRGHEFSGLGCVWVDLLKPVGGGVGGGGPCLARPPRPPAHSVLRFEAREGGVGDPWRRWRRCWLVAMGTISAVGF